MSDHDKCVCCERVFDTHERGVLLAWTMPTGLGDIGQVCGECLRVARGESLRPEEGFSADDIAAGLFNMIERGFTAIRAERRIVINGAGVPVEEDAVPMPANQKAIIWRDDPHLTRAEVRKTSEGSIVVRTEIEEIVARRD